MKFYLLLFAVVGALNFLLPLVIPMDPPRPWVAPVQPPVAPVYPWPGFAQPDFPEATETETDF